ncbi:MAG: dihydrofolate reductase [Alphaproteobacteria bacterium]|nr:dihydrofolate reductase [Alphaproteobacteria bacterium]
MKTTVCAIVAIGPQNIIGMGDHMPWYCAGDFYHFRKTTMGYPCIFGNKTFQGLPKRPLPGRLNIVCSSKNKDAFASDGCFYAASIESAIRQSCGFDKVFICGGASIYNYAFDMDLIDEFYLTKIQVPELMHTAQQELNKYTLFPKDPDTLLSPDKWQSVQIVYPNNVLPPEKTPVKACFLKYTRIR